MSAVTLHRPGAEAAGHAVDHAADHAGAAWRPSPNFGDRDGGKAIDAIVLHYTGMGTGEQAENWLCDPASGVSSHYIVHENGRVVQMVREAKRAWHAGIGCWHGERDMNSVSVGIEIANTGHRDWADDTTDGPLEPFPDAQVAAVIALCRGVMERHRVLPERVVGHSDLAPHRKRDPGEAFPWGRLAAAGIGRFVAPAPIGGGRFLSPGDRGEPVAALQAMLAMLGFECEPTGQFCEGTETVVRAFQRHWRPARIDGVADESTIRTLHALLSAPAPSAPVLSAPAPAPASGR